jgi:2-methylaconitate cis-trans-isomerase PrpF
MEFLDEPQHSLNAVFMRGGTSKAVFFRRSELPPASQPHDNPAWNAIFCAVLGSPDAEGRQLDGLGGGLSSLSKIAIIDDSNRPDADVDFTFAQVGVRDGTVGYKGNCGNISAAVACYAVDEGLVSINGSRAGVRIFNTNTRKLIHATVPVKGKKAAIVNDAQFTREPESGVELRFLDPGGAATGQLLPTGNIRDTLLVRGIGPVEASCVDAANPTVFILAAALGLTGRETPSALEANPDAMRQFESVRIAAAMAMGLATTDAQLSALKNLPLVSLISPQAPGERAMILTRMVSAGQPHRAIPLTGAMCLAIAAQVPGSIVAEVLQAGTGAQLPPLCIGHAGGEMMVAAKVVAHGASFNATEATVYRTARRLMEGRVLYPAKV